MIFLDGHIQWPSALMWFDDDIKPQMTLKNYFHVSSDSKGIIYFIYLRKLYPTFPMLKQMLQVAYNAQ